MQVRVLRILEYIGDIEAINKLMEDRAVKGSVNRQKEGYTIRESIIGDTMEILKQEEKE